MRFFFAQWYTPVLHSITHPRKTHFDVRMAKHLMCSQKEQSIYEYFSNELPAAIRRPDKHLQCLFKRNGYQLAGAGYGRNV